MQHHYDGQIRRYLTQTMRMLSNFPVKDGTGEIKYVPVVYGDMSRQVASIIAGNSENSLPCAPQIGVYITGLELDRERMGDSTFVSKLNVRERAYDSVNGRYLNTQGKNYTVERLMPTPYRLKINADFWTSNVDQKLQLLEQIAVWFNPSLEIQTTDNYVDWTSVTVVNLENITWTNRSVPVGTESQLDVATMSFDIPIYISPPAKVKRMDIITNIITSIFDEKTGDIASGISRPELNAYDDFDTTGATENEFGRKPTINNTQIMANVNYGQYLLFIDGNNALLYDNGTLGVRNWRELFEVLPGNYSPGLSRIYAKNTDSDVTVSGTFVLDSSDEGRLTVSWDSDTFPQDDIISGPSGNRTSIDYIIDPTRFNPTDVKSSGIRLLLLKDVGNVEAEEPVAAWANNDGSAFVANANDIVEWDGSRWHVIFDSVANVDDVVYTTNLNTNTQYVFMDNTWRLSVDGDYPIGTWRLELDG